MHVRDESQQHYLENSYRVLLIRAREGMLVYVPLGDSQDNTRTPAFYAETYDYLKRCGIPEL